MKIPNKIDRKVLDKIHIIAGDYIYNKTNGKIQEDFYETITSVKSLREIIDILTTNKLISSETSEKYTKWINKYELWLSEKTTPVTVPLEKISNDNIKSVVNKYVFKDNDTIDKITTDFNKLWSELKVVQTDIYGENSNEFIYYKSARGDIQWVFYINEDENKAYFNNSFGYNLWDSWKTKYYFFFDDLKIITSNFINIALNKEVVKCDNISGVNVAQHSNITERLRTYLSKQDNVPAAPVNDPLEAVRPLRKKIAGRFTNMEYEFDDEIKAEIKSTVTNMEEYDYLIGSLTYTSSSQHVYFIYRIHSALIKEPWFDAKKSKLLQAGVIIHNGKIIQELYKGGAIVSIKLLKELRGLIGSNVPGFGQANYLLIYYYLVKRVDSSLILEYEKEYGKIVIDGNELLNKVVEVL